MAKNVELLLLKTVETLGIVGDVVRVKPGYARNYLLPHRLAAKPTPTKIEALKEARAEAQAEMSALRSAREQLIEQLTEVTVTIQRSCNDQGGLYGSVTQPDIADALHEAGHGVTVEYIRLSHPIRHVGSYPVPIQFDKDLRIEVTVIVNADHELPDTAEPEEPSGKAEVEASAGTGEDATSAKSTAEPSANA